MPCLFYDHTWLLLCLIVQDVWAWLEKVMVRREQLSSASYDQFWVLWSYGGCCFHCGKPLRKRRQALILLPAELAIFVPKEERYLKMHRVMARFVWFRCEEMILWFKRKSHFLWETPRSKYLLHFLPAADYCWQNDTLQRSGLPLAPRGSLSFSGHPVARGFVTM